VATLADVGELVVPGPTPGLGATIGSDVPTAEVEEPKGTVLAAVGIHSSLGVSPSEQAQTIHELAIVATR
jgi:hypothetical protein